MSVPSFTLNKVCLSGMDAIALADQLIRAGEFDVVVAGGQESMSQAPHLLLGSRNGYKFGDVPMRDHMQYDGLWDAFTDQAMGSLTEAANEADRHFSREEQDAYAARSHQLAAQGWKNGLYDDEVVAGPDSTLQHQPALAVRRACAKEGIEVADLDLVEINEAFAAVALATARQLG